MAKRVLPSLCLLLAACDSASSPDDTEGAVTYYRDVVPIMRAHCTGCHYPGGAGPFALDNLADVRIWAPIAVGAMRSGEMPPWMPDRSCRTYQDERGISQSEIDKFTAWIDGELVAGDPSDEPAALSAPEWHPTDVVTISEAHLPSSADTDDYHCFVLDLDFDEDSYLVGSQVIPGSSQVHHVLVYAMGPERLPGIQDADDAEAGPGYTCFGGPDPRSETGGRSAQITAYLAGGPLPNLSLPTQIGSWVPGAQPQRYPDGAAIRITKGSRLVAQVHYNLTEGAPKPDSTRIELALSDVQPAQLVTVRPMAVLDLDIPANDPAAVNVGWFPYYNDAPLELASVTGHMHLLGTEFEADVLRKDEDRAGDGECALRIPAWDFHWQQAYRLKADDHITLNDGDAVRVSCTYDNSAAHQPTIAGEQRAPRDVSWGESTIDEMCILYYSSLAAFAPTPPIATTPCEATAACIAECGETPSLDCIFACPEATTTCSLCALREGLRCSRGACIGALQLAADCFGTCMSATVMLGSNAGRCMAAECATEYADVLACMDAPLAETTCEAGFASECGIGFAR